MHCDCFITDEKYWFNHYGYIEPGSQYEWNPNCPVHWEFIDETPIYKGLINAQVVCKAARY